MTKVRERLEKHEQAAVLELATLCGWKTFHVSTTLRLVRTRDGLKSIGDAQAADFPDLVLGHPERKLLIIRELKVKGGAVTPGQQEWLDLFTACGFDSGVWWLPEDFEAVVKPLLVGSRGFR